MIPAMTLREINVLKTYLYKSTNYVEFGSGGSTVLADTISNIQSIISVESDKMFGKHVQSLCSKAQIIWINIGEISSYGHPKDDSMKNCWPNYSSVDVGMPDTILIDGRFRVACGLQCCLKYRGSTILIHDFTNRPEYHVLLKFLDIEDQVDTLVVTRVKPNINKEELLTLYEKYMFIQD